MSYQIIDNADGIITYSHVDGEGNTTIGEWYDSQPILERNKKLQSIEWERPDMEGLGRRVASIPITLARKWLRDDGINEAAFWTWPTREQKRYFAKRYLSSDWMHLRTTGQKLQRLWVNNYDYKEIQCSTGSL